MSVQLSAHVREEIDRWVAKFPPDRKRSAVISALHAAQHENNGFLTPDLMDAVAAYLGLAPIHVYEVATFYSMFETKPVGRHQYLWPRSIRGSVSDQSVRLRLCHARQRFVQSGSWLGKQSRHSVGAEIHVLVGCVFFGKGGRENCRPLFRVLGIVLA